jgi:tRNA(adenine34) deaminase
MFNENQTGTMDQHRRFMFEAFRLAEQAFEAGEVPVGAVVVQNNRIVGRGYNQVELLSDPTAHAEMIAISSACSTLQQKYLQNCTLYVTLEPCPMCAGAIVWSKMERLVFGAMDEIAGGCGSRFNIAQNRELNHSVEVIQGVMEEDARFLLKEFFRQKRRQNS